MNNELVKNWLGNGAINVFGRPFAGKDTVCKKLAEKFNATVLGGGDILRNSIIPDHVQEIIDAGGLAPTADYVEIVLPYLAKSEFAGKPLILSSVGRWIGEEQGVVRATSESGHPLKVAIYLDVSADIAHARLQAEHRGRVDDHPEKLERRFEEFTTKTLPVIDEYEKMGLLIRVDGTRSPDDVFDEVLRELTNRASTSP